MTPRPPAKPAGDDKKDGGGGGATKVWAVVASLLLAVVAFFFIKDIYDEWRAGELLNPDSPPGEYLYLDRSRVRTYLGQLVDGLPESEKRTLADNEDLSAEVKAGGAGLSGSRTRSRTTEAQVAPTVADRFYLLLRLLRDGDSKIDDEKSRHWLATVNAESDKPREAYEDTCELKEGDFIRIRNARLLLSPYAAVLPKTTYALLNRRTPSGSVSKPDQKLFAPRKRRQKRAVNRYLRMLGRDPRMPFVVRMPLTTQAPSRGRVPSVTFFVPARYRSLRTEPSLISGTLTIVGKVVYKNLARPPTEQGGERIGCNDAPVPDTFAKSYLDRHTVATFVPALENAPAFVFNNLRFTIEPVAKQVTANMTVIPPLMVVVPIAMYQ